ncbi:hypothetical protein POMI540_1474 [Schizosaccharomyces pombe]|uniref:Uncharacterized protein C2A9.14 n=1 Tax=Schizosaccharomyces pombe (strain 972 / ATCC 24843) TaxID=284812 RepID=YGIE_SCHPO|nr:uncharacterized protein SPBC2A9.14 [Schizosaccharomyces pombe]G2TRR6.1 RecName: Full=Uncharacterized protein C2A9.14 [Schizosaccharomyces pombe 972h-]CCD31376.1 sequence orphan [Schizosaccharomyces pombe]|eukprot:NP_001343166.1 uncharacterized protein SPBC2A9.14 [Schizosaccharomyces pombe]
MTENETLQKSSWKRHFTSTFPNRVKKIFKIKHSSSIPIVRVQPPTPRNSALFTTADFISYTTVYKV